ncbi:MAG TPA: discoidin domain-containing protein, partial [Polyangia bacterium]
MLPVVLSAFGWSGVSHAATVIWGGGTGTWSTAANWVGGAAPTSSDTVTFKGWAPLSPSGWTITASATAGGDTTSEMIDGRRTTNWTTGNSQSTDDYIRIDMGSSQTFGRVDLDLGTGTATDYIRGYNLEVSSNGSSWTSVATGTGSSAIVSITFSDQTAQYIRIYCTSTNANWLRVGELIVWGTSASGPTKFSRGTYTVTASNTDAGSAAANAIDSDLTTRWTSGAS